MSVDIYRGTTNVIADPEISAEIWANAIEESFFMKHARRIAMPGTGVKLQTITGEPTADWTDETAAKPVSTHTFGAKTITPYKLAVIEPFSMEFARDKKALYDECVRRLPGAIAKKFDTTIMGTTAPGSGFDVLGSATAVSLVPSGSATVYDQFLAVDSTIAANDGFMDAIGLAPAGKSLVQAAVDGQGRPLFTPGVDSAAIGNILGAGVDFSKNLYTAGSPSVVGIAGDFSNAVFGTVANINLSVSDAATLTSTSGTINLWQQNMLAVRCEVEIAFAVDSVNKFVRLTGNNA